MAGKEQQGGGAPPPPRLPSPAVSTQPPIKKLVRQLDFTSAAHAGNPAMAAAAAVVNRALQPRTAPLGYPQPHPQLRPVGIPHPQPQPHPGLQQPRGLPVMRPHQLMHVPLPRPALAMTLPVHVPQLRPAQPQPQPVPRPPAAVPL
jgi:hypothetical protein